MQKLNLKGLTKRYGTIAVVDHIDLALQEGEFVSLLGPSGCGKTTTLRMIAGFIDPSEGTIEMNDRLMSSPAGVGAAGTAQHVDDLPVLRHLAEHDGVRKRGLRPARAKTSERGGAPPHHRDADDRPPRAAERPLSERAVGRTAAARGARARHRREAGGAAAGRAAVEPRRQFARGDARRDPAAA